LAAALDPTLQSVEELTRRDLWGTCLDEERGGRVLYPTVLQGIGPLGVLKGEGIGIVSRSWIGAGREKGNGKGGEPLRFDRPLSHPDASLPSGIFHRDPRQDMQLTLSFHRHDPIDQVRGVGGYQIGGLIDLTGERGRKNGQEDGLALRGRAIQAGGEVHRPIDPSDDRLDFAGTPIISSGGEGASL
jgi:hypothetical protein